MLGLKREGFDKYYTKKDAVSFCMEFLSLYVHINDTDLIIEPSAGDGAFIDSIKELSNNYLFYDIEPEHDEIIKQDFLNFHLQYDYKNDKIHIIGNPPFGRQSTLAIKFIKKAASLADTISFILPKSFKKQSMQKHFPNNFHLEAEIDLPTNSFLVNNDEHDVPCIFQIWVKKSIKRAEITKQEPIGYYFVKKSEDPDLAFRRVGVNAGSISQEITNKSEQSHYFIKFTNSENLTKKINKLKNVIFNFNNTVGPKSIAKQEIIQAYNQALVENNF